MIRALAALDIAPLAAGLARLPLMRRYGRTEDALAADLRAALDRGDGLAVWDAGHGPVGLVWYLASGTFALGGYLRLIALFPEATGTGAGAKLLAEYEARAGECSRHAFLLVSDFNVDAQRFYQRHGYVKVGSIPKLVRTDVDEQIWWKRLR